MNSNGRPRSIPPSPGKSLSIAAEAGFASLLKRFRAGITWREIAKWSGNRKAFGEPAHSLEWTVIADLLDRLTPDWSYAIRGILEVGDFVIVTAAITVQGVTREGIGAGLADCENGIQRAEQEALKRAAAKFGIARDVYRNGTPAPDVDDAEEEGAPPTSSFDPLAKTKGDLISPRQLSLIWLLARRSQLDAEAVCQNTYRASLGEISRRAASALIAHLRKLVPSLPRE